MKVKKWSEIFKPISLLNRLVLVTPLMYFGILFENIRVNYSNVPYWDDWDSRISMNPKLHKVSFGYIWQQHNEHRIIFSKILFLLDFVFFNGNGFPLLLLGVVIVLAIYGLFLYYILKLSPILRKSQAKTIALASLIGILLFSTMQNENFLWAFQSGFFLAILLPMIAINTGYKYIQTHDKKYLVTSLLISVCSMGTMASGLLTSVCIVLMFTIARVAKKIIFISIAISLLEFATYFSNYTSPNSSPLSVFFHHPTFVVKYVILYLSEPFTYIIHGENHLIWLLVSLIYIFTILRVLISMISKKVPNIASSLVPLMVSIFVLLTAMVSAGGRYQFGVSQATASRYTSMSLTGWCCILTLMFESIRIRNSSKYLLIPSILALLLYNEQTGFLTIKDNQRFDRTISALALELNIKDNSQLKSIYPDPARVMELAQVLITNNQSVFGEPTINQSKYYLGKKLDTSSFQHCLGNVDTSSNVTGDSKMRILVGWIYDKGRADTPLKVLSLDSTDTVTGYGLTGMLRSDVSVAISAHAQYSGFKMYSNQNKIVKVIGLKTNSSCFINVDS